MGILFVIFSVVAIALVISAVFIVVDHHLSYKVLYSSYEQKVISDECLDAILGELLWADPSLTAYTARSSRVYRARLQVQIASVVSLEARDAMLHCNSVLDQNGRQHFLSWITFRSPYSRLPWVAWISGDKYHLSLLPKFAFYLREQTRSASPEAISAYIAEYQDQTSPSPA